MLVSNFQSLELALRAFLYAHADGRHDALGPSQTVLGANVGATLPVNALTDYDTLGRLITRFNALAGSTHLDPTLVSLRDALAHGRVASDTLSPPLKLIKFGKAVGAEVRVEFSALMTDAWLAEQVARVREAIITASSAPGFSKPGG